MPEDPRWLHEYQMLASQLEVALVQNDASTVLTLVMKQHEVLQSAVQSGALNAANCRDLHAELQALAVQASHHSKLLSQAVLSLQYSLERVATRTEVWNSRRWV